MPKKLNKDKIENHQCEFCGDRRKKLVHIWSAGKKTLLGYSIVCCGCGHVDNFATTYDAVPVYACAAQNIIKEVTIECAASKERVRSCKNTRCECRPKVPEPTTYSSSDTVGAQLAKDMFNKKQYGRGRYR